MTEVYFVRHAEPNFHNHNDAARELSEKGLRDRLLVTSFFRDKHIDAVLSSPYKRAVDTVAHLAQARGLAIKTENAFRERKIESGWIDDFDDFCRRQWDDFDYKRSDGEALREVQMRNIAALKKVLDQYKEKTVIIGSHGTALSTIIRYYQPLFGYQDFHRIKGIMPWVVKFSFDGCICVNIEEFDLFGQ